MQEIRVTEILNDLNEGFTRKVGDKNYQDGRSIAEKYTLNSSQVTALFRHPLLKGKKTKTVKDLGFTIIDDTKDADPVANVTVADAGPMPTLDELQPERVEESSNEVTDTGF